MGFFSSKTEANLRTTRKMVEEVIDSLGLVPEENRLPTDDGSPAWGLLKGSAEVFIFIIAGNGDEEYASLQVVAPVMRLPESTKNQAALFRRLLEINTEALSGLAFGVKGDTAVLVSDRSTEDVDASEVRNMILRVGYYADRYDDELVHQFGGRRYSD